jgi:hypothetical protein
MIKTIKAEDLKVGDIIEGCREILQVIYSKKHYDVCVEVSNRGFDVYKADEDIHIKVPDTKTERFYEVVQILPAGKRIDWVTNEHYIYSAQNAAYTKTGEYRDVEI